MKPVWDKFSPTPELKALAQEDRQHQVIDWLFI
jgi:hypothetical protein